MSESEPGQIITFYSYKGGSGRTMAVANVAWILASNGKKVLAVDWDLESPGLHRFFHPFLDVAKLAATPGLIEIIMDYAWAAVSQKEREDGWYREYAKATRHAVSLDWNDFPEGGTLDFLSAGKQNRDYSSTVSSFEWDDFYDRLGGGQFFEAMREEMKANYDYVLIDSRTGLSDVADICTIQFPDILVDCFTLSSQSIEGGASVARQISKRYHQREIRILPVPMHIDDGEKDKLDAGRALARRRFAGFPNDDLDPTRISKYWRTVEIPYKPFYAFEEILATFGDEPGIPTSLLASFERLTSVITKQAVISMPQIKTDVRLHYLGLFTRRQTILQSRLAVSYAPQDRMWADWVEALLDRAGIEVVLRSVGDDVGRAYTEVERHIRADEPVISILTPAYVASPEAQRAFRKISAMDIRAKRQQLIGVRVSDVPTKQPFSDLLAVNIIGMTHEAAAKKLGMAISQATGIPIQIHDTAIRFPGSTPKISNLPRRSSTFTGRAQLLERLRDELVGRGRAVVVPQALFGLGGIGKTQVVLEYAYRFAPDYDLIWWVPSEDPGELTQALAELAERLEIRPGQSRSETVASLVEALRHGHVYKKWLLIFDNADDPQALQPYLPGGAGHVLITSLNQAWSNLAEAIQVDVFSRVESTQRLMAEVPGLKLREADRVAAALGDLPLAIEQAVAWLKETGMPPSTYAEELEGKIEEILVANEVSDDQATPYPAPLLSTWDMSFKRINERSPAAARLLQLLAFCSPGPISMHLLYSEEVIRCLNKYEEPLRDVIMLGTVIRELSRFAMVTVDQGTYSVRIHRLVQAVVRSRMDAGARVEACRDVHSILVGARPRRTETYGDSDDPENWDRYNIIWPHLSPSRAFEYGDADVRNLLIEWVRFLWRRNDFDASLRIALELDSIWTQSLGRMDRQLLYLRFHRANILRSLGSYQAAYELDRQVLNDQRKVLGPEHPAPLMTAGSLAADLRALGRYSDALEQDLGTYSRLVKLLGADHRRTLSAANNLAVSHRLVGNYSDAMELDQATLHLRTVVLGEMNPYTLCSAANLGRDLREAGQYADSIRLLRMTYNNFSSVLGEDELDTLRTATSLAVSLRKAGDETEARNVGEYTIERYLRRYSDASPDVLSCKLSLACDYAIAGEMERARDTARDVRDIYEANLGATHPYSLTAANNLSIYLRYLRAEKHELELCGNTLQGMREALGEDHPVTLSCALNAANYFGELGDLDRAIALGRKTVEGLHGRRGPQHPETLICEANLAVTLRDNGQSAEAEQLRHQSLMQLVALLGDTHRIVAALNDWRRVDSELETQPV